MPGSILRVSTKAFTHSIFLVVQLSCSDSSRILFLKPFIIHIRKCSWINYRKVTEGWPPDKWTYYAVSPKHSLTPLYIPSRRQPISIWNLCPTRIIADRQRERAKAGKASFKLFQIQPHLKIHSKFSHIWKSIPNSATSKNPFQIQPHLEIHSKCSHIWKSIPQSFTSVGVLNVNTPLLGRKWDLGPQIH